MIAKELPGRTDNDVKNYWNTKLRKKLTKMGIDHVTHKPYSQILADYGNISALPNTATRMGSFSRGLNNTSVSGLLPYANTNDVKPLVEQFQVLNLETVQPHFFSEVPSSSSSSSSCSYITQSFPYQPFQPQLSPSSPLGWNDFLLAEPLLPSDFQQQKECDDDPKGTFSFSSTSPSILTQNELPCCKFHGPGNKDSSTFQYGATSGNEMEGNCHKASSSSSPASSFVESILDRDSKMCAEFPELLGESFDY